MPGGPTSTHPSTHTYTLAPKEKKKKKEEKKEEKEPRRWLCSNMAAEYVLGSVLAGLLGIVEDLRRRQMLRPAHDTSLSPSLCRFVLQLLLF